MIFVPIYCLAQLLSTQFLVQHLLASVVISEFNGV